MTDHDHRIMLSVREGNVDRLSVLFERYHVKLYNYFLYQIKDKHMSEDLTHEVFFRILKYRKSYQEKSKFSSWMYKIARNVFMDHCNKNRNVARQELDPETVPDNITDMDSRMDRERELNVLRKAMDMIEKGKRELLLMSRFRNMRYKDIGETLGCSESAVKVRVYRALKDLADIYFRLTGDRNHEL